MRITVELLRRHNACADQVARFAELYPEGLEPTVEGLTEAAAAGLDTWWTWHLLPPEGPGGQRAYALWCAEQVAHLCPDPRVEACLAVVRRRVADPASVSDEELDAAWAAAGAAAGDAEGEAQLGCLADLLGRMP